MAIRVLRGGAADAAGSLAIGEPDRDIFNCPICSRPLAVGVRRCPGCRTRLVLGVQALKAMTFAVLGLGIGLMFGGGVVGVLAGARPVADPVSRPLPTSAPVVRPSVAPSVVIPSPTVVVVPVVPATAIAALRSTATIDGRLQSLMAPLAAELVRKDGSASEIARILRRVSFEAGTGSTLVEPLGRWPDAQPLATQFAAFYVGLRSTAQDGLGASVTDMASYRATGTKVLRALSTLATLDKARAALATSAGIEIPV
ncbi:MAG: hypothetical protein ACJ77N_04615, partial [Chloroflexota bacterium]